MIAPDKCTMCAIPVVIPNIVIKNSTNRNVPNKFLALNENGRNIIPNLWSGLSMTNIAKMPYSAPLAPTAGIIGLAIICQSIFANIPIVR